MFERGSVPVGIFYLFFFLPSLDSLVCPSGPQPPLLPARRPNRGHIGGGGWTPSCSSCLRYVIGCISGNGHCGGAHRYMCTNSVHVLHAGGRPRKPSSNDF
ncbi:unnamed protein product [Ectocarpus sp. 4 AP-2014]